MKAIPAFPKEQGIVQKPQAREHAKYRARSLANGSGVASGSGQWLRPVAQASGSGQWLRPVAQIALLLSGIMVLKKLMSAKGSGGGGGHESSGWSSGGSSGGWDRRAYDELAYSAYKPE
ncbi:unnamed protein product [Arctia plantaginis]|uniref:Uncharacterized protein n=1 Tax=Arctia plantaginis TaxID=874455 RepID=A0A8S1BKM4_ARCPL|nr:unnamed protein product [Arctia plantaginis]